MEKIPILRMGEFLLVTIQVDMHDQMALKLQDDLSNAIVKNASRGVLIDISSLEMVDSFIGRMVADISSIGKILGAETILVGCSRRSPSHWSSWACHCLAWPRHSTSNAAWCCCVGRLTRTAQMSVNAKGEAPLRSDHDIVLARQQVRRL